MKQTQSAWQSFLTYINDLADMGKKNRPKHKHQSQPQAQQPPKENRKLSPVIDQLRVTDMLVVPSGYVAQGPVEEEIESRGMMIRMENLYQVGVVRSLNTHHIYGS